MVSMCAHDVICGYAYEIRELFKLIIYVFHKIMYNEHFPIYKVTNAKTFEGNTMEFFKSSPLAPVRQFALYCCKYV